MHAREQLIFQKPSRINRNIITTQNQYSLCSCLRLFFDNDQNCHLYGDVFYSDNAREQIMTLETIKINASQIHIYS